MTVSVEFHRVKYADVAHFPDHKPTPFATVVATDVTGNEVTMYFPATDGVHELAVAEAWLRNALAKVEVAKIDAANDQPAPVLPERVSNETCGVEMARGIPGVDEVVWTCTRPTGHGEEHSPPWPLEAARIGEPFDLTAGAL